MLNTNANIIGGGFSGLVKEYKPVFSAMEEKPTGLDRYVQNKICRDLVSNSFWNRIDYMNFYAAHTNGGGEALLNYKLPAGGTNLLATGKGNFDTDTESWIKWGNNLLERVVEDGVSCLKLTYVDSGNGAYNVLRVEKTTNLTPFRQSNLTIGSQDLLTPSFLTKTAKNFS